MTLRPGENGPARFVGEFADSQAAYDACTDAGDVATFTALDGVRRYFIVRCALCDSRGALPLQPSNPNGWQLTATEPVNIEPSIRTTHYEGETPTYICHFFVHGGQFQALSDSTVRSEEQ